MLARSLIETAPFVESMTEARLSRVREIMAEELASMFGDEASFGPFYMSSDVDHDGIEYAVAHVIYESADEKLDVHKRLRVIRPIWNRVLELGETATPVVAYIPKSEEAEWLGDSP